MVIDALKKSRDAFAYALLAVAALYVISGLSLLLKSASQVGLDFSGKAAAFGYLFASPVVILSLVAAVALVVGFGEASRHARSVVLIALAIAAVALLLGLVCWLASFGGNDTGNAPVGGVFLAGQIVGTLLGLASLLLLGLTAWFAFVAFRALPKLAPQSGAAWGQPEGYDASSAYGQPAWGRQDAGYGQQPSGWSSAPPAQGWPAGQAGGATAAGASAAGWGDPSQEMPDYQGQPASAWASAAPSTTSPAEAQGGWGAPGQAWQEAQDAPAAGRWRGPEGAPAPAHAEGAPAPPRTEGAPTPPRTDGDRTSPGAQPWPAAAPPPPERPGSTAVHADEAPQEERPPDETGPLHAEGGQPRRRSGWWRGQAQ